MFFRDQGFQVGNSDILTIKIVSVLFGLYLSKLLFELGKTDSKKGVLVDCLIHIVGIVFSFQAEFQDMYIFKKGCSSSYLDVCR